LPKQYQENRYPNPGVALLHLNPLLKSNFFEVFQGKIRLFSINEQTDKRIPDRDFSLSRTEQSQSFSSIIFEESEHKSMFEVIGMNFAMIGVMSAEKYSLNQTLNLLAESKTAVWDFLESQRDLLSIVQDRKIHHLVTYLSILSTRAWISTKCPLKSNYCTESGPWCARQFKMKKCLRCELEYEAMRIAKQLDFLKKTYKKGGEKQKTIEKEMDWESERRFCSKGKVFFYH